MRRSNFFRGRFVKGIALVSLATAMAYANTPLSTKNASRTKHHSSHKRGSHKHLAKSRGQQKIDHQRAGQIQEALIREHYLNGEASGTWDDASQRAMEKYQASNGWQTKVVPDARALIKLGLGPDEQHLLNPESAMTAPPQLSPRTSPSDSPDSGQRK